MAFTFKTIPVAGTRPRFQRTQDAPCRVQICYISRAGGVGVGAVDLVRVETSGGILQLPESKEAVHIGVQQERHRVPEGSVWVCQRAADVTVCLSMWNVDSSIEGGKIGGVDASVVVGCCYECAGSP
jgi:hypothetical protein